MVTENDLRLHSARICLLVLAAALPVFGQYGGFGGPSILSRGGGPSGRTGSRPIGFRPYAGVSANYLTNLNSPSDSTESASLAYRDGYGLSASAGVQGYKSDERSSTSLDLGLGYFWNRRNRIATGFSQSLGLSHSRQISRRVVWSIGANVQSTNRSLQFANEQYSPEPVPELDPANEEVFDNRISRANVGTGFTFQKSARLSFSAQGGAFGMERKQRNLIDSRGFSGSGSAQYSLSRRQHIGASFSYGTFYFPGHYGETQYYSPQGVYGISINKVWSFNLSAGIYQSRTRRLVTVQLDPFIAELTGQRTALETFDGTNRGFSGSASLNGNYRNWGVSISARRGLRPGNGIYMTSERTSFAASASHTLGRSASFSLRASRTNMKALTQTIGGSEFYSAGTSFSYRLNSYLSFSSSLNYINTSGFGRRVKFDRINAAAGIFFSPGDTPLHLF